VGASHLSKAEQGWARLLRDAALHVCPSLQHSLLKSTLHERACGLQADACNPLFHPFKVLPPRLALAVHSCVAQALHATAALLVGLRTKQDASGFD
jgi:hypothetical protein